MTALQAIMDTMSKNDTSIEDKIALYGTAMSQISTIQHAINDLQDQLSVIDEQTNEFTP